MTGNGNILKRFKFRQGTIASNSRNEHDLRNQEQIRPMDNNASLKTSFDRNFHASSNGNGRDLLTKPVARQARPHQDEFDEIPSFSKGSAAPPTVPQTVSRAPHMRANSPARKSKFYEREVSVESDDEDFAGANPPPPKRALYDNVYDSRTGNSNIATSSRTINHQGPPPVSATSVNPVIQNSQSVDSEWQREDFPWSRDVKKGLRLVFNLKNFRKNQVEIVNAIMSNKNVFVLMPTGGGKSLCYQASF